MFDFHVHTHHSFDGSESINTLVEKAIQMGFQKICLTDHVDYDYDGAGSQFSFSYESFFDEITKIRNRAGGRIDILAGVEFGLQPHLLKKYQNDAATWPFDYIIGSIHSVQKTDIFTGPYFETRNQEEAYRDYFDDMQQVLQPDAPFDTLGHFDMIKRYGGYKIPLPLSTYEDIATTIFTRLISMGKGIEINTSGFRYGLNDAHPSLDLLSLYHRCGGEIIVLGSDAHQASGIGDHFKDILSVLTHIGFRYLVTYKQRKAFFHPLHKLIEVS